MKYIFNFRYKREFGFVIENREITVDDIRVRGIGKSVIKEEETIAQCEGNPAAETVSTLNVFTYVMTHEELFVQWTL